MNTSSNPENHTMQTRRRLPALLGCLRAIHPARRASRSPESGAIAVEFVLVLPFLIAILMLVVGLGKAFNYRITETHLASEGARFAAVGRTPDGGNDVTGYIHGQVESDELADGTGSVTEPLQVCVEFPNGTEVGSDVTVRLESTYQLKLPFTNTPLVDIPLDVSATHRLERKPEYAAGCS